MQRTDKDIILELEEDNKLLSSKIDIYKDEIKELKNKLEYTKKLFILYESIMEYSKNETKELNRKIKHLEEEISTFKNK